MMTSFAVRPFGDGVGAGAGAGGNGRWLFGEGVGETGCCLMLAGGVTRIGLPVGRQRD